MSAHLGARGSLIALNRMDHGGLTPELVTSLYDPSDAALQDEVIEVISSRPEWARMKWATSTSSLYRRFQRIAASRCFDDIVA